MKRNSACATAWDKLLVHQLDYRTRPCNLVELMPRLLEHRQAWCIPSTSVNWLLVYRSRVVKKKESQRKTW